MSKWVFKLYESEPNTAYVHWPYGYAEVHGSRSGREKNARLIAAAPDLFDALQDLERLSGTAMQIDDPARVRARKAIEQATQKPPHRA